MSFGLLAPAIGGIASLAIQGIGSIPGKYQKAEKKRAGELSDDIAAGRGLSAAEAATMENTGMRGVRAQTGSMASELARLQAAGGGMGGGAAAAQARDSMAGTIGDAAEKVGYRVAAANQDAIQKKRQEQQDIAAAAAQRKADMVNNISNTVSSVATQYGEILGGPKNTVDGSTAEEQASQQNESLARQQARAQTRSARRDERYATGYGRTY